MTRISDPISTLRKQRANHALLGVLVVFSLQALTVLQMCEWIPSLKSSPTSVVLLGVGSLLTVFGLALFVFFRLGFALSWVGCFFVVVLWSAMIDLILSLALLGWTNLGVFYYQHGEEYFTSSWGFWALLWDGTFHYSLQLYLAFTTFTRGRPNTVAGLLWSGSIINSMPVLLMGAATGVFSGGVKPSTALNAPYIMAPIAIFQLLLVNDGQEQELLWRKKETAPPRETDTMTAAFGSMAWGGIHALAIVLHVWRAIVVLGCATPAATQWIQQVEPFLAEPNQGSYGFLRIQLFMYFFYYVPFHFWALIKSLKAFTSFKSSRPSRTMALWATFVAGGYAQGQTSFIVGAAFQWIGFESLIPSSMPLPFEFWTMSVSLLTLPALYAIWCWRHVQHLI